MAFNHYTALMHRLANAVVVIVVLACGGAFGALPRTFAAEADIAYVRNALIAAGDPDALAAAALLNGTFLRPGALTAYIVVDTERLELIHRAVKLAPDRYDLALVELRMCERDKSCDSRPTLLHLQALDPRNAVSWIGELPTGETSTDDAVLDIAIRRMAESERFDTEWASTVRHLAMAFDRTKTLDDTSAISVSEGIAAALSTPRYADVLKACSDEALKHANRLINCKRLAAIMRLGDTYEAELLGIAISKRVWPKASDSYRDAAEAARRARYRMLALSAARRNHLWDDAFARKYLAWLVSNKSEQDVYRAELVEAGSDPEPPAYYVDADPARE